jgi:hypothetical protein
MSLRLLGTLHARNFWGVTNGDFRHALSFNLVVGVLEDRAGRPSRNMSNETYPLRKTSILQESVNNTLHRRTTIEDDLLTRGGAPRKGAVRQKYAWHVLWTTCA